MTSAEIAAALVVAFVLGACAGSFLGVVIHRLPRGMSIVHPPSRCGACGTSLVWFENLPILGWLLLRGRCRHCGTRIPVSCLLQELGVAILTTAVTWGVLASPLLSCPALIVAGHPGWAQGAALAALLVMAWIVCAAVLIDLDLRIIPDELSNGLQLLAVPLAAACSSNLQWPWNPLMWLRHWDVLDGWEATPGTAAWRIALAVGVSCLLILASMPLARWIHGRLAGDRWQDHDYAAMRAGGYWYTGWTLLWCAATVVLLLWAGTSAAVHRDAGGILALSLMQALLGSLVGWWLPWSIALGGTALFRRPAMGYGDVKLFAALGAFLGPVGTLAAFMLAVLVGTVVGIPARLLGGGREMPFGPSLAIGAVIAISAAPWLVPWVERLFAGLF